MTVTATCATVVVNKHALVDIDTARSLMARTRHDEDADLLVASVMATSYALDLVRDLLAIGVPRDGVGIVQQWSAVPDWIEFDTASGEVKVWLVSPGTGGRILPSPDGRTAPR